MAILRCPLELLERSVRSIAPAEGLVVDGESTCGEQVAVIAAIDDLVDVAQRDPLGWDARVGQDTELPERARAPLAVRLDGDAGPPVRRRRGAKDRPVALRRPALAPGNLD